MTTTTKTARTAIAQDSVNFPRYVEICAAISAHRKSVNELKKAKGDKDEIKSHRRAMHVLWMEREQLLLAEGRTSPYLNKKGEIPQLRTEGGRKRKAGGMIRKEEPVVDPTAGETVLKFTPNGGFTTPEGAPVASPAEEGPVAAPAEAAAPAAVEPVSKPTLSAIILKTIVLCGAVTPSALVQNIDVEDAREFGTTITAKMVADALGRLAKQNKVRKAGAGRYAPLA
jgi:hypothetical protein